ncbi:MAG TPA: PQQ-binding-like beta-propeller repeat protein [Verrucomicrobiae bacterium]|nr:PQQ-binding-like beta-propeller repeat protein [Verrucomicrobiae bacterium]
MKVQCPCGSKYAIDVTPEMARDPVRFICPECNTDLSGPINDLIRQELGLAPAPAPVAAPAPVMASASAPGLAVSIPSAAPRPAPAAPAVAAPSAPRLSIARSASAATHGAPVEAPGQPAATGEVGQPCPRHKGEFITEHCYVCRKPLCPKCMELFGYVCSPLCRNKAEAQGIDVPLFAGQRSVREAQEWRKKGLIGWSIAAAVAAVVGLWGWYTFYASRPHSIFRVRFPEMAYAGSSQISDKQIVFLHGFVLARYPLGSTTPVWTNTLLTQDEFEALVDREMKGMADQVSYQAKMGVDSADRMKVPQRYELEKDMLREVAAAFSLYVDGQNIWVARDTKLTRYDWSTGKPGTEVQMPTNHFVEPKLQGGELLFTEQNEFGQHVITHINLASGETTKEMIGEPVKSAVLAAAARSAKAKKGAGGAGLPTRAGGPDSGKPLDPKKVEQQAQNMSYAGRVALPATLSSTMEQQRALDEMKRDEADAQNMSPEDFEMIYGRTFIQSKYGYVQWSQKLLEEKRIGHTAMKAAPAKSVLDSNPTVGNSLKAANEILNQMQRDRGGDVEEEDVSRYQVTVHRPDAKDVADWTGEIIGPPRVFEQKTVTVVAGGSSVTVIDKSNKKVWQADLPHKFGNSGFGGFGFESDDSSEKTTGEGPCVERGDTLYVYDEATLTAFDLANGNVRWRVPSIGIQGVFFDDQGAMYVNSTTADLDSIKYSRQIDITRKTDVAVLKVDCKSGKVLWTVQPGGSVSHVEGKYVLCFVSNQSNDDIDPDSLTTMPGMVTKSVMDIRRLDPKNGKTVFDYVEDRAPVSVKFHGNIIELVFRKEVEVLKFISL